MVMAGGDPAIHRPLAAPKRGCGQPRPAASATNARRRCVRSGETRKLVSPFSFARERTPPHSDGEVPASNAGGGVRGLTESVAPDPSVADYRATSPYEWGGLPIVQMAGADVAGGDFLDRRALDLAAGEGVRAARMEGAAGRRVERRGQLAGNRLVGPLV